MRFFTNKTLPWDKIKWEIRDSCTIKKNRDDTTKVTPPEVTYFHSRLKKVSNYIGIRIGYFGETDLHYQKNRATRVIR